MPQECIAFSLLELFLYKKEGSMEKVQYKSYDPNNWTLKSICALKSIKHARIDFCLSGEDPLSKFLFLG